MNEGGRVGIASLAAAISLLVPCAAAQAGGGITLSMTAVVDETPENTLDDVCGVKEKLTVDRGEVVDVCYTVRNLTGANLTRHELDDSVFGIIFDDFPFTLAPSASAFIVQQKKVKKKTRFQGRWVAAGPASIETDRDELPVKVRR